MEGTVAEGKRSKAEVLTDIERLLGEYLTADTDYETVVCTGFVMKVQGRSFDAEGNSDRLHVFGWPKEQDTFTTLGLVDALSSDAAEWYARLAWSEEADNGS